MRDLSGYGGQILTVDLNTLNYEIIPTPENLIQRVFVPKFYMMNFLPAVPPFPRRTL